jgi:hypothetical protein
MAMGRFVSSALVDIKFSMFVPAAAAGLVPDVWGDVGGMAGVCGGTPGPVEGKTAFCRPAAKPLTFRV